MTMPLLVEHFDDLLVTPENAIQLNHAVLQLAIQGKLVEQNPKDEAVKSVLKRLLNWNEENFSNSATELEKPFDIPESWEWRTIGDVCQTTSGGTPSRQNPNYYGGNIPWLKSGELEDTLIERIEESITEEGLANSSAKIFPAGTPLIALYGATVGKTGLLGLDAATNQAVCALFPAKEIIDTHFLLKYLQSQRQKLLDISAGGAQPNISQKVIREWLIPIPPLAEQQRIIARVEELFVQIRALTKELAHSQSELDGLNKSALSHLLASETPEEFNQHWYFIAEHFDLLFQAPEHIAPLRQSILELAVRGKLTRREAGDESAGELLKRLQSNGVANNIGKKNSKNTDLDLDNLPNIPENWLWCRVGDICDCIVPNRDKPESFSGDIPWITLPDFNSSIYISKSKSGLGLTEEEANLYNARLVPANSVVMSCIGRFGIIGILTKDAVVNQQLHAFLIEDGLNAEYLAYALKTQVPYMEQLATSTTIKYLNKSNCNSVPIPLPPTDEQERIVKRVEQLLSLCDALEGRLRSAEEERGRLVRAVMSTVGG